MDIVVFAPYAGIWQHAFPEAALASTLQQAGHTIYYVTCDGLYRNGCLTMSACGQNHATPTPEKLTTCERCISYKNTLQKKFHFNEIKLSDYITPKQIKALDALAQKVPDHQYSTFTHEDIQIGTAVLNLIFLTFKKSDFTLSNDEKSVALIEMKHCLYTIVATQALFNTISPDRVLIYNTQVPTNHVLMQLSKKLNKSVYYLHAGLNFGNRLNRMIIGQDNYRTVYREMLTNWETDGKRLPATMTACQEVTDHYQTLLDGINPFVYSSGIEVSNNVRDYFGVSRNQKILLLTLSSYDELFAAKSLGVLPHDIPLVFSSQIEWVNETIEFVQNRKDLFLIVRVHPREFPNKKESITSDHARALQQALVNLPENVCVNWPTDNISIYDFVRDISLCLNFISSAGKELTLFGIPVISYAPLEYIFYPTDIIKLVDSKKAYFESISHTLCQDFNFENIRLLYRWYALEFCYSTLDLSNDLHLTDQIPTKITQRINQKLKRMVDPLYKQKQDCKRFANSITESDLFVKFIENNEKSLIQQKIKVQDFDPAHEKKYILDSLKTIYSRILDQNTIETKLASFHTESDVA